MNLSDEKVSQAMAAVMGIEYHPKRDKYLCDGCPAIGRHKCDNCYEPYFDAHTPDGIWQWKEYTEREMAEEWEIYLKECLSIATLRICFTDIVKETYAEAFTKQLSPRHLVKYLFDNLDSWGYKNCWHTGYAEKANCLHCKDTGKVLTERASKFKAIVEGGE
jgi:hypothetical protein